MVVTTSMEIFVEKYRQGRSQDFWNSTKKYQKFITPSSEDSSEESSPVSKCDTTQLIVTPISAKKSSKAKIDYEEQCHRVKQNLPLVWDDSMHNKSRVGDKFGFWFYNEKVHIHTIVSISSPADRLPSWSENVGQGDRKVVTLSKDYVVIPWEKWIELDGKKRCMGTSHVLKGLENILEYVK